MEGMGSMGWKVSDGEVDKRKVGKGKLEDGQ